MEKILSTYIAEENKGRVKLLLLPLLNELFLASLIFIYSFAVGGIIAGEVLKWLVITISFMFIFMLTYYFGTYFSIACQTNFDIFLKNRLLQNFCHMNELTFEAIPNGQITEIIRNVAVLSGALTTFPAFYFKLVKLGVLLCGTGLFLGGKVLVANLILVLIMLAVKNVSKQAMPYQTKVVHREEILSEQMIETVEGIETIKSYELEAQLAQRFDTTLQSYLKESLKKKFVENILSLFFRYFNILLGSLSLLAILLFSVERPIGFLISSTMLSVYLAQSVGELLQVNQDKTRIQTIFVKYQTFLSPRKSSMSKVKETTEVTSFKVQDLTFKRDNQSIIQDFSYDFSRSGLYLIKGESGKGKSTLLKLLSGLYPPSSGYIRVNHQDNLQGQVIYMPQQNEYLLGSIIENVYFSETKGKDTESYAEVADFDPTSGLSGGQIQLINLVRALNAKKQILILDEPLSALDKAHKARFKAIIAREKMDKILIITTHDAALDDLADAIIDL